MLRKLFFLPMLAVLLCLMTGFARAEVATETTAAPPPIEKEIVANPAPAPAAPAPTASELVAAPVIAPSIPAEKIELQPGTIGTVIEVEGTATRARGNSGEPLAPVKADDAIFIGDVIQTGENSRVLVLFIDDSRLTLGGNAGAHVMEYAYDVPGVRSHAYISVTDGPFMYASGKLAMLPKPDVKFLAEQAAIQFNGATGWAGMFEGGYTIFTDSGETLVETNRSRTRVPAGYGTRVENINTIPERPAPWDTAKIDEIKKTVSLKRIDHIRSRLEFHQSRNPLIAARQVPPEDVAPSASAANTGAPAKAEKPTRREVVVKSHNVRQQRHEIAPLKPAPEPAATQAPEPAPKKEIPPVERTDRGIRLNAPETQEDAQEDKKAQEPSVAEQPFPAPPPQVLAPADPATLPADPAMQQEALEKMRLDDSGGSGVNGFAPATSPAKKPDAF